MVPLFKLPASKLAVPSTSIVEVTGVQHTTFTVSSRLEKAMELYGTTASAFNAVKSCIHILDDSRRAWRAAGQPTRPGSLEVDNNLNGSASHAAERQS